MSISKAWYVSCSDCGAPADITADSAIAARRIAHREGFVRVRRDGFLADLCPACGSGWTGPTIKPPWRNEYGTRVALTDVPLRATPTNPPTPEAKETP